MAELKYAVITPVRGRLEHLVNQRRFLESVAPETPHVIAAVDMPNLRADLQAHGVDGENVIIVDLDDHSLGMPTARARNLGAHKALAGGADILVFLDVDCAPLPGFFEALAEAPYQGAVINGVVTYLPENARLDDETPETASRLIHPHPVRPAPESGDIVLNDDHHLLWSLAFALDAQAWRRTGGFDERYVGYGAEDTDFGLRARGAGLRMAWVGAHALHQWHPSANPPVHHLSDIVRNATLYYERWGSWPMEGWLREFAAQGLIDWTSTSLTLR